MTGQLPRPSKPTLSLIVTTYNWPAALACVLASVAQQRCLPLEVIVADDGSGAETHALLKSVADDYPVPLRQVWQEDVGFRAARVRNLAIAAARGEYLVTIDGDMVLHPDFLADHLALARADSYLQGGRLHASAAETARLLAGGAPRFDAGLDGDFKRRHARRIPWLAAVKAGLFSRGSGKVMSCNQSYWRSDALRVNGFDERFVGWGYEDREFAARLELAGVRRRPLKFAALAIHLWHGGDKAVSGDEERALPNYQRFQRTLALRSSRCESGLDGHPALLREAPLDMRPRRDR
ncbi:MAG: glycosyltransferase family 2 protein [Dokdonella sp.]